MSIESLFQNVLRGQSDAGRRAHFLLNNALFCVLGPREARFLGELLHHRVYAKDEVIFKEGEESAAMYIIYAGGVDVFRGGKSLIRLVPGDFFGEISLFDECVRSATTVATEERTELLLLSKGDLDRLMTRHPAIAVKVVSRIATVLARRLKLTNDELSRGGTTKDTVSA